MKHSTLACVLALAPMALVGALAVTTVATPALAEGSLQPVAAEGASCPAGWSYAPAQGSRIDTSTCYPTGKQAREVYRRRNGEACRDGYNTGTSWCEKAPQITTQTSTGGSLIKPSTGDRCPSGYYTNNTGSNAGLECITKINPAPVARTKSGKACKANEVDEYGLWCTSNYEHLTSDQIQMWAMRDYNNIYAYNRGLPTVISHKKIADLTRDDMKGTPVHTKMYGPVPETTSASSSSTSTAASNADTPVKSCETAVEQGAAVGGAVAGTKGKVIGGLAGAAIGGLGKKKKKSGC